MHLSTYPLVFRLRRRRVPLPSTWYDWMERRRIAHRLTKETLWRNLVVAPLTEVGEGGSEGGRGGGKGRAAMGKRFPILSTHNIRMHILSPPPSLPPSPPAGNCLPCLHAPPPLPSLLYHFLPPFLFPYPLWEVDLLVTSLLWPGSCPPRFAAGAGRTARREGGREGRMEEWTRTEKVERAKEGCVSHN